MKPDPLHRLPIAIVSTLAVVWLLSSALWLPAATFPGNAIVEVSDSTGGLSWITGNNPLSVSCWFKLAVPSGTNLTENMTILVNRRSGTTNDVHAYRIFYNINSGNIEFTARGGNGYINTLIERPYLERWYHVAVVREAEVFTGYADGRQVFSAAAPQFVGDARSTDGLSIGGWGSSQFLYGEVQEVAVYQSALDRNFINQYMFSDQPTNNEPGIDLKGYFKLGYATNAADSLRNWAPAPVPVGSEMATTSGPVQFEETNQAGEQSTFDSRRNGGRDALSPLSGAFSWSQTAFARPTPGVAFEFRVGYSSANAFGGFKLGNSDPYASGVLGKGWRHTFETRIVPSQDFLPQGTVETIGLMSWDGAIETWDGEMDEFGILTGAYHTRHREYRGELYLTNSFCEWRTPERLIYKFRRPDSSPQTQRGLLVEIRDFNSNAVQILRNNGGTITQVVDTARGAYNFQYRGSLLTNIVFGPWQMGFAYDATNRLVSKSFTNASGLYTPVNTTWQFFYNAANGLLERIVDPRTNNAVQVTYDKYGRKVVESDALGQATSTEYGVPAKRQIRHTDPATFQWLETYDRKGHVLAQQDPLTNITHYTYDERGNRTSITEPLGWTTFFGYDARANVIARTNALGEVTRWVFHSFFNKATQQITPQPADAIGWTTWTNFYVIDDRTGNLTNHWDALGSLVRYTYKTNGLVETSTDANGNVSRFAYDTNGFLIATTDPATNSTLFSLNDVGWKLAATNALNQVTTFAYDLNGNVVRSVDPLQRVFTKTYDANGNLLSASDAKNQFTRSYYDVANQFIQTVDRAGNTNQLFYTTRGKLERTIDPLTNTVRYSYDNANRLVRVFDPMGNPASTVYDSNGNVTNVIDKLGQNWTKTYDELNRVKAESDPLGNTRQTKYDITGRVKTITSPNGYPSLHFYDGRGRLTNWVDAMSFEWKYSYDGNGNIVDIEDALHGHYRMGYDSRNARTNEVNQDNKEWHYRYDKLLRPDQQTDPNGTVRTIIYDDGGRIDYVTFSTGRVDDHQYDENNNLILLSRSRPAQPPTSTTFAHDVMDRVTECTDAFSKKVRYAYDALGRVSVLTYPDGKTLTHGYDALSRLTNQVFTGQQPMTYVYDQADRLIRRTYPNGVTQTNAFDNAGRITGLSYSTLNAQPSTNAIAIALTYAYDRNGNKTGSKEIGTLNWSIPTLTDETARYTAAGRLVDRDVTITNQASRIAYHYDPSGNMTNATGNGQSWTLAYDEDNRTTSIQWDAGVTSKVINNRYDALGRRVAKTVDNAETHYVLNLVGGMERILCDTTSSGQITAWYVHGPDLCFKLDAASNLTCYHADAQANIIALTAASGTNLAQYAYTPYGRSLGSTDFQPLAFSPQPYLFVGSQGVMEELPGLYFMRARYYSAEAGVFLSTDPVKHIGPTWRSIAYTYSGGNPLTFTDPKGEFLLFGAIAGGLIGGAIDLGVQLWANGGQLDKVNPYSIVSSAAKGALVGSGVGALGMIVGSGLIDAGVKGVQNAAEGKALESGVLEAGAVGALEAAVFDVGVGDVLGKHLFQQMGRKVGQFAKGETSFWEGVNRYGFKNWGANYTREFERQVFKQTVKASYKTEKELLKQAETSSQGTGGNSGGGGNNSSSSSVTTAYSNASTANNQCVCIAPTSNQTGTTTPNTSNSDPFRYFNIPGSSSSSLLLGGFGSSGRRP